MIRSNKPFNRFGHGKQVRDVLHVDDIVRALEALAMIGEVIAGRNISGGQKNTLSVLELMSLVSEIAGNAPQDSVLEMRKADKLVMYLNTTKAREVLNWEPKLVLKAV